MAFPGVRAPRSATAEDCGQLAICFSFPKHLLGGEARSEDFYIRNYHYFVKMLCLVVMELSLFNPRCKFIGGIR